MKVAVVVGNVADGTLGGCIDYCRALDLSRVVLSARDVPGYAETGVLDAKALKAQRVAVERAGMTTSTIQFWPPFQLGGDRDSSASMEVLTRGLDAVAEAGIKVLAMFANINKPVEPSEEDAEWAKLVDFYGKLTAEAEQRGVKVATHFSGHQGRGLLAGSNAYRRLFKDVPSPSNGLTFCVGNAWVSDGERTYNLIQEFASRIFFVHMRSTKISWGESPFWWDIPDGPDIRKIVQALEAVGYEGDLASEHMPDIPGENRHDISFAWAIGYMKAILRYL